MCSVGMVSGVREKGEEWRGNCEKKSGSEIICTTFLSSQTTATTGKKVKVFFFFKFYSLYYDDWNVLIVRKRKRK